MILIIIIIIIIIITIIIITVFSILFKLREKNHFPNRSEAF